MEKDNVVRSSAEKKEPLIHIVKREQLPVWKTWLIRAIVILAAVVTASVFIVLITGANPISVWSTMFRGVFKSQSVVWRFFRELAILLGVALALTPAFKMRFWNIGGEGQIVIGGLATYAVAMVLGGKLPTAVIIPLMIIAGILAGALWGFIPAIFKAFFGTNETLFTLMMNYVAMGLVTFCAVTFKWEKIQGQTTLSVIDASTRLPKVINEHFLTIVAIAVLTIGMYIYLKYTKQGYEISVVGESENTARYVGINVKKVIIRTMIISGAICGLIGFIKVSGFNWTVSTETGGGLGFTAIMVSWLAKFNPFSMVLTSGLLTFFQFGAKEVSQKFGYNEAFSEIITGIVLFFIIAAEFFIKYQIKFRKSSKGGKTE
jgi:simple sugar transport system permease protein